MNDRPRRGWRETIESGLYRSHRVACPSSADRKAKRRCACPFQLQVPGFAPGVTRLVSFEGSVTDARAERRRLLAAGRPAAPRRRNFDEAESLTDFAGKYFRAKSAVLAAHTIAGTEVEYRLRIAPALGDLWLEEITRETVEVWLAWLVKTSSSRRMVVAGVAALRGILATAVEWGRIPTNPAARLRLPAMETHEEQGSERVLDERQLWHLLEVGATTLRAETILRAAAEAGLRRGEIIGLRWPDIDLGQRRIEIRRSVWQTNSRKGEKPTKGRRTRRVAISETFAERLTAWRAESVGRLGADMTGFVWPGRDGQSMDAHSPTQMTTRALTRAGLVDGSGKPLVTLHGLRHTCGSILLAHDVPLIVVSRHLGHANPNVTAKVYAHLLGDTELDRVASVFEARGTTRPDLHSLTDTG